MSVKGDTRRLEELGGRGNDRDWALIQTNDDVSWAYEYFGLEDDDLPCVCVLHIVRDSNGDAVDYDELWAPTYGRGNIMAACNLETIYRREDDA